MSILVGPYGSGKTKDVIGRVLVGAHGRGVRVLVCDGGATGRRELPPDLGLLVIDHAEDMSPRTVGLVLRVSGLPADKRPHLLLVVTDLEVGMGWASLVAPIERVRVVHHKAGSAAPPPPPPCDVVVTTSDREYTGPESLRHLGDTLQSWSAHYVGGTTIYVPSVNVAAQIEDLLLKKVPWARCIVVHHMGPPGLRVLDRVVLIVTPRGENHLLPSTRYAIDFGKLHARDLTSTDGEYRLCMAPPCRLARRLHKLQPGGRCLRLYTEESVRDAVAAWEAGPPSHLLVEGICRAIADGERPLSTSWARQLLPKALEQALQHGLVREGGGDRVDLTHLGKLVCRTELPVLHARILDRARSRTAMMFVSMWALGVLDDQGDAVLAAAAATSAADTTAHLAAVRQAVGDDYDDDSGGDADALRRILLETTPAAADVVVRLHGRYFWSPRDRRVVSLPRAQHDCVLYLRQKGPFGAFVQPPPGFAAPDAAVTCTVAAEGIPYGHVARDRYMLLQDGIYVEMRNKTHLRVTSMASSQREAHERVTEWVGAQRAQLAGEIAETWHRGVRLVVRGGGEVTDVLYGNETVTIHVPCEDIPKGLPPAYREPDQVDHHTVLVFATREGRNRAYRMLRAMGVAASGRCRAPVAPPSTAADFRILLSATRADNIHHLDWASRIVVNLGVANPRLHADGRGGVVAWTTNARVVRRILWAWESGFAHATATRIQVALVSSSRSRSRSISRSRSRSRSRSCECDATSLQAFDESLAMHRRSHGPLVAHHHAFCRLGVAPLKNTGGVVLEHRRGTPTVRLSGGSDEERRAIQESLVRLALSLRPAAGNGDCPICMESGTGKVVLAACGHALCPECLSRYVDARLEEPTSPVVLCPIPDCQRPLLHRVIATYR